MKTRSLDRNLAKQDPEGSFDSPFGIVEERLLTRGEKIATLNRWRKTVLEELTTSGKGMPTHAHHAHLLQQIEEAKSRLGAR